MNETSAADRLDSRTVLVMLVTLSALTVVDAALGRGLFDTVLPVLAADVALAVAVLLAGRHLLGATLFAAASSTAVSAVLSDDILRSWAARAGIISGNSIVGLGALPGIGELAGMAVLCAMAIRYRPTVEAAVAAAAYGGALLALVRWRQHGLHGDLFVLVLGVTFAATVMTGLYTRSIAQRRVEDARATRQAERDAIARELHDLVAHHVTGMVVQAQAARLVAASRPDVTVSALSSIERAGADALSSMRAMVGALRADTDQAPIAPTATFDDIRRLATSGDASLPVTVSVDPAVEQLPSSVTASLHRIAIEALTNARRHGRGATGVDVAIETDPHRVRLSVTNDGDVVTDVQEGFGLVGIAERVAALGGQFEAGPRASGGWAVVAVLPTGHPGDRR